METSIDASRLPCWVFPDPSLTNFVFSTRQRARRFPTDGSPSATAASKVTAKGKQSTHFRSSSRSGSASRAGTIVANVRRADGRSKGVSPRGLVHNVPRGHCCPRMVMIKLNVSITDSLCNVSSTSDRPSSGSQGVSTVDSLDLVTTEEALHSQLSSISKARGEISARTFGTCSITFGPLSPSSFAMAARRSSADRAVSHRTKYRCLSNEEIIVLLCRIARARDDFPTPPVPSIAMLADPSGRDDVIQFTTAVN